MTSPYIDDLDNAATILYNKIDTDIGNNNAEELDVEFVESNDYITINVNIVYDNSRFPVGFDEDVLWDLIEDDMGFKITDSDSSGHQSFEYYVIEGWVETPIPYDD